MMSHCHPSNCRLAAEQKTLIRPNECSDEWKKRPAFLVNGDKNPDLMTIMEKARMANKNKKRKKQPNKEFFIPGFPDN